MWWKWGLLIAGAVALGVVTGGAGYFVAGAVAAKMGLAATTIVTAKVATAAVVGLTASSAFTLVGSHKLSEEIVRETEQQANDSEQEAADTNAEVVELRTVNDVAERNDEAIETALENEKAKNAVLEATNATLTVEKDSLTRENADKDEEILNLKQNLDTANTEKEHLKKEKQQLKHNLKKTKKKAKDSDSDSSSDETSSDESSDDERAGAGFRSLQSSARNYRRLWYSVVDMNRYLKHIPKQQDVSILSAKSITQKHQNELEEQLATLNLPIGKSVRILFPWLDIARKHWCMVELTLNKQLNIFIGSLDIKCCLHDPRGGGQFNFDECEQLTKTFSKAFFAMLEVRWQDSPYQSCRQSTPDKISCGSIVLKEIELRSCNRSLDRTIPYAFGVSELVAQQSSSIAKFGVFPCAKKRNEYLQNLGGRIEKQLSPKLN